MPPIRFSLRIKSKRTITMLLYLFEPPLIDFVLCESLSATRRRVANPAILAPLLPPSREVASNL